MPVAPSFQDLLTQGQAEAQARRPDLVFAEGDISVAQLHGAAAMADAVVRFAAQLFRETFIDGARGDALTTLVDDHLNVQRDPATAAQVVISLSRPYAGGAEPGGTILAGTTVATDFDAAGRAVQFTTDSNVVFALAELGPKTVTATATITGTDGNVAAGAVSRVIDQPSFDPTFTVTNAAKAAGGNVEESDDQLRARARSFWVTLRRGTLAALEYGAKLVPEVRVAKAIEDVTTGDVTVYVTDADGNSTLQMVSDVTTELENWRCAGSNVVVAGGSQLLLDITISLVVSDGFDVEAYADAFAQAATTRISKLKVGETLYLDSLIAAVIGVAPDDVMDVEFDAITGTPGGALAIGDVTPTAIQVIRPGTMTVQAA